MGIDRLGEKIKRREADKQNARSEAWAKIQAADPVAADLLVEINRVFGKPAVTQVTLDGEVVVKTGTLPYREDAESPEWSTGLPDGECRDCVHFVPSQSSDLGLGQCLIAGKPCPWPGSVCNKFTEKEKI